MLLSHPVLRKPSYEIFLRTHQALAVLSACSIWRHLPSDSLFPRMYIYISAGLFVSTSVVQCVGVLWRNGNFRHGCARALVTHAEGSVQHDHPQATQLTIQLEDGRLSLTANSHNNALMGPLAATRDENFSVAILADHAGPRGASSMQDVARRLRQ